MKNKPFTIIAVVGESGLVGKLVMNPAHNMADDVILVDNTSPVKERIPFNLPVIDTVEVCNPILRDMESSRDKRRRLQRELTKKKK